MISFKEYNNSEEKKECKCGGDCSCKKNIVKNGDTNE